ncbi:hypothetical protein GEV33_010084 [Tenebrio molitor]|uniref:Ig-like domain-containing protein n=1 Tax=Tenebrio molitor TaxID=7067 RepID=A0A8J6LA53_TENMO|nr:hypothetical protein GEV33_010084 [Tenebrio molitor]
MFGKLFLKISSKEGKESLGMLLQHFSMPPRIHYVTSNGRVEVKKGSTVKLECRASGNPVPKITWSRKNNVLPSGDQTLQIPVLTLDRVDRHQAGVYKCMANNGVGEDVTQEINLHVLLNECYNGGNGDVYNPSNMTGVDFMGVLIDRSWIGVDWSRQKESDVLGAPPEAFTTATGAAHDSRASSIPKRASSQRHRHEDSQINYFAMIYKAFASQHPSLYRSVLLPGRGLNLKRDERHLPGPDSIRLICDMRPVLIPRCDGVEKPLKKTTPGQVRIRTRDLASAKWRARRLATMLGGSDKSTGKSSVREMCSANNVRLCWFYRTESGSAYRTNRSPRERLVRDTPAVAKTALIYNPLAE